MKKTMLFGILLSLFGCSQEEKVRYSYEDGKAVTEFQGFKWGESSQLIYEKLGEPREIDPNGMIFTYSPEEIRLILVGNKVKATKFYFRPPVETEIEGFCNPPISNRPFE